MESTHQRGYAWIVVITSGLFILYNSMQVNLFNAITPSLIHEFHLDATHLGILSASYLAGLVLVSIPIGILLDRYSNRRLTLISLFICILGLIIFAFTHNGTVALIARFISGIGGSFSFLCSIVLAARWFRTDKLGLATGVLISLWIIGGGLAQTPLTYLTEIIGWRDSLWVLVCVGVLIWALIFILVADLPGKKVWVPLQHKTLNAWWQDLRYIVRHRQTWLASLTNAFTNLPVALIGAAWGSVYLMQARHLTLLAASYNTLMIFVGALLSSIFIGWISDRLHLRKKVLLIGIAIACLSLVLIIYLPTVTFFQLLILFFILGFSSNVGILSHPIIVESVPTVVVGIAQGFAGVIIMSAAMLIQPLYGLLLETHWTGRYLHQVEFFSVTDYHFALSILPVSMILAFVVTYLIRETHAKKLR